MLRKWGDSVRPIKGVGYKYEVSMKTLNEGRPYNIDFRTDKNLTEAQIGAVLESLCDVEMSKIKRVTEYKIPDVDQVYNGIMMTLRTKLGGIWTRRNKVYLPRVKPTKSKKDVEDALKILYGSDLEITSFQERL